MAGVLLRQTSLLGGQMRRPSYVSHRLLILVSTALLLAVVAGFAAAPAFASPQPAAKASPASAKADGGNWWDILPRPEWKHLRVVKLPKSTAWFEVHKAAPGVFAIYEPGNWQEVISYLIVGQKKALLWDTGMDIGSMKLVVSKLTKLPVTVLNSHAHFDHMSGDYQFKRIWNLDNPYARSVAKTGWSHDYVAGNEGPESMNPNFPLPTRYDPTTVYSHPYKVTHWVHGGDKIDLGNRVLRVVTSPGHSPDGICLFDKAQRLLLVGDVFYNSDLYAHIPGANLAKYTATAVKLAKLAPRVGHILPSHNVTMISSKWLVKMNNAFQAIKNGTAMKYTDYASDGVRVYDFGYFRIDVRLSDVTP